LWDFGEINFTKMTDQADSGCPSGGLDTNVVLLHSIKRRIT